MPLCTVDGSVRQLDHTGGHEVYSSTPWQFLSRRDNDKKTKAGFATPRGGAKGAYQNHVLRSNKVIVPFELFAQAPVAKYETGYVVRLFPDQYIEAPRTPKTYFLEPGSPQPGASAFALCGTREHLRDFPALATWKVRSLTLNGAMTNERAAGALDEGEYVVKTSAHGSLPAISEGPPQGIFAPEYANQSANFLSKCLLAWLTAHTTDSPYVTIQVQHLEEVLQFHGKFDPSRRAAMGLLRNGLNCCPLCFKLIKGDELHDQISFTEESSLLDAADQVANSARSTIVNLFYMAPLTYADVEHTSENVDWRDAICNTKLGQRICHPIPKLIVAAAKAGTVNGAREIETFGWASTNLEIIRSPAGTVCIKIVHDHLSTEDQSALLEYLREFEAN